VVAVAAGVDLRLVLLPWLWELRCCSALMTPSCFLLDIFICLAMSYWKGFF
jgi:hypothetical protein